MALAVSETVTNAVIHAYAGREPGPVTVRCQADEDRLVVEVADEGAGIAARPDSPGIGQGLALVGAIARSLEIASRADGPGTIVTMSFGAAIDPPEAPGLEPLCALALEHVADVSCVDMVDGGVLRRAAAEVAGDPALTAWLRATAPPAKPGTATWGALREGAPGWSSTIRPSRAHPGAPASGSGWRGGSPWRSRATTGDRRRCGAWAAAKVAGRSPPRRCCARSPAPPAATSPRRAGEPRCAHAWPSNAAGRPYGSAMSEITTSHELAGSHR